MESARGIATNNSFSFVRARCSFVYILSMLILVNRQPPDGYIILVALGAFRTVQPRFVRNHAEELHVGVTPAHENNLEMYTKKSVSVCP